MDLNKEVLDRIVTKVAKRRVAVRIAKEARAYAEKHGAEMYEESAAWLWSKKGNRWMETAKKKGIGNIGINEVELSDLIDLYQFDFENFNGIAHNSGGDAPIKPAANFLEDGEFGQRCIAVGFGEVDAEEPRLVLFNMVPFVRGGVSTTVVLYSNKTEIYTLDEHFLQPYDYQRMLEEAHFKPALCVHMFNQTLLKELQDFGIITGFVPNEYI